MAWCCTALSRLYMGRSAYSHSREMNDQTKLEYIQSKAPVLDRVPNLLSLCPFPLNLICLAIGQINKRRKSK